MSVWAFVYGTLKGMSIGRYIGNGTTIRKFFVAGRGFPRATLNEYPHIINDLRGFLNGQIYEVSDDELKYLKRYEGCPTFYSLENEKIKQPNGVVVDCVMFHANEAANIFDRSGIHTEICIPALDNTITWPEDLK